MRNGKWAAGTMAVILTVAVGLAACTPTSGGAAPTSSHTLDDAGTTALLQLNEQLRQKLGAAYSQSWIEGTVLHIAVTTQAAKTVVSDAGAVPLLVDFNSAQLEAAVQALSHWQATLPAAQGRAIYKIIPDGRTGTVSIYVAPEQLTAVTLAAAADHPAGKVPLLIKASSGLPTPQ